MRHRSQLGAGHWPFIIALLFAIVFAYMWYGEQDKVEGLNSTIQTQKDTIGSLNKAGNDLYDVIERVDRVVGFHTGQKTADGSAFGRGRIEVPDWDRISAHLNPGMDVPAGDGTAPSYMKQLVDLATLSYDQAAFTIEATKGEKKEEAWKTVTAAFLEKQKQVEDLKGQLLRVPTPPADPDDTQGHSDYQARRNQYEAVLTSYNEALAELTSMEGWKEWNETIHGPGNISDANRRKIVVSYFRAKADGYSNLENAIAALPPIVDNLRSEVKSLVEQDQTTIRQLRTEVSSRENTINTLQANLASEQQARTTEVGNLQNQLAQSQSEREQARQGETTARNDLARAREEFGTTVATKDREIDARKEQARLFKEKRDLVIARDDPDGSILASNPGFGTATIDLGSADKAFVGLKFTASDLDRGGNRVDRGQVMIVKVLGPHSSQVRIVSGQAGSGYRLHNPFYQPGERIHVFFAGKLDKWPVEMARERLERMNVVVQSALDGKTDYVVIPNSWTIAKEDTGGGDEEEGGEEAAGGASPLDKVLGEARSAGATVITERLLDAFLDY